MTDNLKEAAKYYSKGEEPANKALKTFLEDSPLIVHGGQALNAQLPSWLDKETKDWDIFAPKNAEKQAKELEKKLDKRYGADYFAVKTGKHPGTFRVYNKITGEVIADITLAEKTVEFKKIKDINYATLDYHEDHILDTLDDPTASFRHDKDRETLQRIQIHKRGMKPRKSKFRRTAKKYTPPTSLGGIRQ